MTALAIPPHALGCSIGLAASSRDLLAYGSSIQGADLVSQPTIEALLDLDSSGRLDYLRLRDKAGDDSAPHSEALDPMVVASLIAPLLQRTALVFGSAPVESEPFVLARETSTMDHMMRGRTGWEIIPLVSTEEYEAYSSDGRSSVSDQLRRSREYLRVLYALWEESWDDDAATRDRVTGLYTDPAKIHLINHAGPYYLVDGPFNVEPSVQRSPVLFWTWTNSEVLESLVPQVEAIVVEQGGEAEADRDAAEQIRRTLEAAGRERDSYRLIRTISLNPDRVVAIDDYAQETIDLGFDGIEFDTELCERDWARFRSTLPARSLAPDGAVDSLRSRLLGHDRIPNAARWSRELRRTESGAW